MHCYIFISLLSCICNILKRSKYFLYKMIIFYRYLLFNTIKKTVSIGKSILFLLNYLNFQVIYLISDNQMDLFKKLVPHFSYFNTSSTSTHSSHHHVIFYRHGTAREEIWAILNISTFVRLYTVILPISCDEFLGKIIICRLSVNSYD